MKIAENIRFLDGILTEIEEIPMVNREIVYLRHFLMEQIKINGKLQMEIDQLKIKVEKLENGNA